MGSLARENEWLPGSSSKAGEQKGSSKASVIVLPIPTLVPASHVLTGGRLSLGELIPLARAGQAYRLTARRRKAGIVESLQYFRTWPAGQRVIKNFFPHYIHKVHPSPRSSRHPATQGDTGEGPGSLPGGRGCSVSAKQSRALSTAVEIAGAGCALSQYPSISSPSGNFDFDLSGIIHAIMPHTLFDLF